MRNALASLLVVASLPVTSFSQPSPQRLLAGFEDDADISQWRLQRASAERTTQHATQGRHALQLTLPPADYPGLAVERGSPLLRGWSEYDFLRFDVFNPQAVPVEITVRIDDLASRNYATRYNEGFALRPGKNTIDLPVQRLQTSDRSRNLKPDQIKHFMVFGGALKQPVVLFLDNLRLEKSISVEQGHDVRAFDFGPASSPVAEGFTRVTAADRYDKTRGWGWIAPARLAEFDDELPDSLCRDYVAPANGATATNTFVVDVPNGDYRVVTCTRDLRVADPYRGIDHDWWPEKDVWKEEILPKFLESGSTVTVTNGQIALCFTGVTVYWLAVLPPNDGWLESLHAARRREFYEKYFYLEPYRATPNPASFRLTLARSQVATIFFNAHAPEISLPGIATELRAVRLMERPVNRGVYRIEPMALMPVTNRPHASRFALTLHADKPGSYQGKIAGIPLEVRVWPFELPSPDELDITYGWYYGPPADPAMRDKELRDMAEHGFNSVTAPTPRLRLGEPGKTVWLDTSRAEEFLRACRRAGLVKRHPTFMNTWYFAEVVADGLKVPEFSEQFLPPFKEALRQFREWARTNGSPVLASVVDEPREQAPSPWNRNFAETKRFLELYRQAGVPAMVTLMGDSSSGRSYLPLVPLMDVVSTHPTRQSRGIFDATRAGNTALWIYNAGMNRFSFGFYPWAVGAKGRWEWHYQWWTQAYDPFARTSESAWSTGTGAVMPSPDGPLPTEAYECVRAGIDDCRFLALAERRPEARRFLEELRGKIPRYLEGELPSEATLDEWRDKLAEIIAAPAAEAGRNP